MRPPAEAIKLAVPARATAEDLIDAQVPAAAHDAATFHANLQLAKNCLHDARSRQKLYTDGKHRDASFLWGVRCFCLLQI